MNRNEKGAFKWPALTGLAERVLCGLSATESDTQLFVAFLIIVYEQGTQRS